MKYILLCIIGTSLFIFMGCDDRSRNDAVKVIPQAANQFDKDKEQAGERTGHIIEKSIVTQKVEASLDEVNKEIDDFSLAFGLQSTRFSYGTNLYLMDYTNVIAKFTDEELIAEYQIIPGCATVHKKQYHNWIQLL